MAKYFTIYQTYQPIPAPSSISYSVYYDQINENNYAKVAYRNDIVKTFSVGVPAEIPYNFLNVEVPDSASSVIVVGSGTVGTQVFPLVSTPPTMSTLFLTFDTF